MEMSLALERWVVAEVEVLGNVRHRNIVRLLGCCNNIFLDAEVEARVVDFCVTKLIQIDESMSVIAGSYGYIAPEYHAALPIIRPSLGRQHSIANRVMQGYLNHFLGNISIVNSREPCLLVMVKSSLCTQNCCCCRSFQNGIVTFRVF